jgi:hypothetical protein
VPFGVSNASWTPSRCLDRLGCALQTFTLFGLSQTHLPRLHAIWSVWDIHWPRHKSTASTISHRPTPPSRHQLSYPILILIPPDIPDIGTLLYSLSKALIPNGGNADMTRTFAEVPRTADDMPSDVNGQSCLCFRTNANN